MQKRLGFPEFPPGALGVKAEATLGLGQASTDQDTAETRLE